MDAEAAANSAAIQLVSFKDAMEDEFAVCLLQFFIKQRAWALHVGDQNSLLFASLLSFFVSIKDSRQSAIDKCRITRQRRLLLEKLEDFRRINKSVRQKLKQLQEAEVGHTTSSLNNFHDIES